MTVIDGYNFKYDAKIVQSTLTGKFCKLSVIAEGDFSGSDFEILYELIGLCLRENCYGKPVPKRPKDSQP
jgi:hypothetical protein